MPESSSDRLLAVSRVLLVLLTGLFGFAMIMVGIGTVAVLTVQRAEILQKVVDAGLPPIAYWGVIAALIGVAVMFYLALRFVSELRAIIDSVENNDPFVAANADRLERMGWLAIAVQVIEAPIRIGEEHLRDLTDPDHFELGGSSSGIALVFTLFILARVFRQGTRIRDDLEGTV